MNRLTWRWFNTRSKIEHYFYENQTTLCGLFLWSWDRKKINGKRRCKNCERALAE